MDLTKEYAPPGRVASLIMRSPIKTEVLAVDHVNLAVKAGELFGLIGPNGAGKTTLVKMLSTLLWPTSGSAFVGGFDIRRQEDKVKALVGFVSGEERSLYFRLTGRQNLEFYAALCNLFGKEAGSRIDQVLERLGLSEAADNMVYTYSSGMKQKLSIARGLLADPVVLFLDEPTKSIDPQGAHELKRFIKEELVARDGRTVFLTSHRLEDIEQLCDRFAILRKGKVTFCGTVAELKGSLGGGERYILRVARLARNDALDITGKVALREVSVDCGVDPNELVIDAVLPDEGVFFSDLIAALSAKGAVILSCERQGLSLEDMFMEHIRGGAAQ